MDAFPVDPLGGETSGHPLPKWSGPSWRASHTRRSGYRACLGILSLAKAFTPARLEAASDRALLLGTYSYHSLESILKHSLDRQPALDFGQSKDRGRKHDNIRGAEYYSQPPNLFLQ